ncbi:uncharacterized protein LOC115016967 [Cottoperca gobio]|uniref:Uncharacterized protein LOC115016967 n=1 Tax=Cottoperca gobio TaxID=56716 RepID=A0A6J2QTE4_COTGO|nr:uncharacterized protein LOC115016967 [Cottoperca gobio]
MDVEDSMVAMVFSRCIIYIRSLFQKYTKSENGQEKFFLNFHSTVSSKLSLLLRTFYIRTRSKDSQRQTKETQQTSIMENCDVPVHLRYKQTGRRISARQAEGERRPAACRQCPCCRDDQVPVLKRKRQRSPASADLPQGRKRTSVSRLSKPAFQTPTASLHLDKPVKIQNRSVEEYQQLYHEAVDHMLRFKSGRLRPYSLALGRRIKQKLWERLDRPTSTQSVNEDGLVLVDVSYGVAVFPPLYDVDVSGEPTPPVSNL